MPSKKHYIMTAITLGTIAAVGGGLVGLTNLVTAKRIVENEKNKINAGIAAIFGESSAVSSDEDFPGYKYTNHLYKIDNNNVAFRTSGSNMYGKISLIVGFSKSVNDPIFKGMSVVVDEQTYASTLEENYINKVNDGSRQYTDVTCNATYGAKLIRDMIEDAKGAALKVFEGGENNE